MEFIFKSNNIKEGKVVKFNRNSDITKNMKLIEWMKNEILMSVSELFNILFKGVRSADEGLQDVLANIITVSYTHLDVYKRQDLDHILVKMLLK